MRTVRVDALVELPNVGCGRVRASAGSSTRPDHLGGGLFAEESSAVIPIHELLSRIRWDEEYGNADFVIGYYDRVEERIITVSLKELYFNKDDHFDFELLDDEGVTHTIPLHRIRQVFRNGELVWERKV